MLRYTFTERRWAEKFAMTVNDAFAFTSAEINGREGDCQVSIFTCTAEQKQQIETLATGFMAALRFAELINASNQRNVVVA